MTKPVHLYASQRVSRRAKDGSDGSSVTIISKSVTYQISASGTEEPKGTWSDKVVLTTDTKPYLWTRTIVLYSDTNSTTSYSVSYRGKDGTSVTILSTSVQYQVSASPTEKPQSWENSITMVKQTDAKPYLWSKTTVTYSDNNQTITFSVSYKGKDGTNGTSFTPRGMADGYYSKATEIPAYSDEQNGKIYLVDDATNVTSPFIVPDAPYVVQYVLHNGEYVLFLVHAEFGDGYNVNGHLYVANDDKWVDFGEIQGAKGDKGEDGMDGKDAINIVFSPAELVFDADENGNLKQAEKSAEIKVYRGTTELQYKTDWDNDAEIGDNCMAALLVNTTTNKPEVKISGITSSNIDDVKVPATSGGANVSVIVDGVKYRAYLPFSVNVNTYANFLIRDNKKYISKYTEISNKYNTVSNELNGKASKDELREVSSSIEQTAREISLSVSEKSIGRRNLLVGSAFQRDDNNVKISDGARIEMNSGYQGTNCIHIIDDTDGNSHYIGVYWDGSQGGRSVKIEKGKKYTISCYYKTNDSNAKFSLEAIYTDKETNAKRLGRPRFLSPNFFNPKYNQWELFKTVIDTTDAESDYIAFNFCEYCNVNSGIINAYICRPMVEEGDTYNGWTLSQDDYDIIGANLIDNSRTFQVGGNILSVTGNKTLVGDVYELTASGSDDYNQLYRIKGDAFKLNTDYTLSFEVRGDAKYLQVNAFYPANNTKYTCYREQQNNLMYETADDGTTVAYVILGEFEVLSKQQKVWVHFRFKDRLPEQIYFQFTKNSEQTGVTSWGVTITRPKIEVGAVVTEYTERKSDLVDKASLKKAGIEITTNQIKLYGDKVQVLTRKDENSEYVEAGMFVNGKLNANLIDADKIEVKHLWAKSEDGTTKVGYFGNYEIDACKVNNANAPLFVGADTAAKSPFYVTNNGHMVSTSATLGCFSLDKMSLRYISGYDDEEPGFALYNNFMLFREYSRTFNPDTHTWKSERKRTVWLGEYKTTYQVPALLSNLLIDDSFSVDGDTLKSGIRISVTGCDDSQQYNNPTYNLSNAVYGNFAIYAEHGMYGGLRPMTRKINRSMELTDMDCFVIVTKDVTLTLPAKPQRGQYYKFLQVGDNFVIKSSSNNMLWYGVSKNSFTSGALNQTTELIYDGSNWNVNWFIGK